MPTPKNRSKRRERHAADVQASEAAIAANISEAARLLEESNAMLRRHRREHEEGDAASVEAAPGELPSQSEKLRSTAESYRRIARASEDSATIHVMNKVAQDCEDQADAIDEQLSSPS